MCFTTSGSLPLPGLWAEVETVGDIRHSLLGHPPWGLLLTLCARRVASDPLSHSLMGQGLSCRPRTRESSVEGQTGTGVT